MFNYGDTYFPCDWKKGLNFLEKNQMLIEKGVFKICQSDLEKIHEEIRIISTMDYVEEVYQEEISDDIEGESDDKMYCSQ